MNFGDVRIHKKTPLLEEFWCLAKKQDRYRSGAEWVNLSISVNIFWTQMTEFPNNDLKHFGVNFLLVIILEIGSAKEGLEMKA